MLKSIDDAVLITSGDLPLLDEDIVQKFKDWILGRIIWSEVKFRFDPRRNCKITCTKIKKRIRRF